MDLLISSSSGRLESIAFLKNQNKLVLSDKNEGVLKIVDLDSCFVDNFKHAHIKKPSALCIGKNNELYISEHSKGNHRVLVFDENLNYLKQMSLKPMYVTSIKIDLFDEQNLLYITDNSDDKIVVRYTEIDRFKEAIKVLKPSFIEFSKDFIFVISYPSFNLNKKARRLEGFQKGSNCIFVINKSDQEIVRRICFDNWLIQPGLCLDEELNITTIAFELSETRILSTSTYLYIISLNGDLVQKIEIDAGVGKPSSICFFNDSFSFCDEKTLNIFQICLLDSE